MKRISLLIAAILTAMLLAACQTSQTTATAEAPAAEMTEEEKIAAEMAAEREANMAEYERQKKMAMEGESQPASAPAPAMSSTSGDLYPPNARPGECYARMLIPGESRTITEKVIKKEASERVEIVPATYKTVTKRVLVKPETSKLVSVPAKYGTKSEKIQISEATTVWKKGAGTMAAGAGTGAAGGSSAAAIVDRFGNQKIVGSRVTDTGELMCLVEVPAQYRTVTKTVLLSPASTKTVTAPAVYKTVEVTELVTAAQEKRIAIPEEYGTVTRTEQVRGEQLTWVPVLCQVNMTTGNVTTLQSALKKNGCYTCNVDGVMGPCTFRGAQCYAKKKGLPYGTNFVTVETIRALGLKF
ncbi:MAG: peptidoglycan-binding protein [Gammaproteobacteria bacterium]